MILVAAQVKAQNNFYKKLPPSVVNNIQDNRLAKVNSINVKLKKFENYLYQFKDFDQEIPIELINYSQEKSPYIFSEEEAIEDVDFLFKLFKYGYAAYEYFGGDQKFNKVKENIIKDIKRKSLFSKILVSSFESIVVQNLNFIQDGHFVIAEESFLDKYYYFTSPRFDFLKNEEGYYTNLDGKRMYLLEVNGEEVEKYMKQSLNKDGKIIYRLGLLSNQNNSNIHIEAKFVNNEKIRVEEVVFLKENSYTKGKKSPYNTKEVSGITVIEHKTANSNPTNIKALEKFSREANKFKDEKFFIIDLRGNTGGNSWYALEWVKNYTGATPKSEFIQVSLNTRTTYKLLKNGFKKFYELDNPESNSIYKEILKVDKSGWSEVEYNSPHMIENNNLIVVLIDSHVASAGECFVSYLRQVENVIFLGVNTTGLVNTGNMGLCQLPNSKINVYLPKDLELEANFVLREGKGFNPDFWVKSPEALDKAISFLKRYYIDN